MNFIMEIVSQDLIHVDKASIEDNPFNILAKSLPMSTFKYC